MLLKYLTHLKSPISISFSILLLLHFFCLQSLLLLLCFIFVVLFLFNYYMCMYTHIYMELAETISIAHMFMVLVLATWCCRKSCSQYSWSYSPTGTCHTAVIFTAFGCWGSPHLTIYMYEWGWFLTRPSGQVT